MCVCVCRQRANVSQIDLKWAKSVYYTDAEGDKIINDHTSEQQLVYHKLHILYM